MERLLTDEEVPPRLADLDGRLDGDTVITAYPEPDLPATVEPAHRITQAARRAGAAPTEDGEQ
jgi:hypothetical protein